MSGCVSLDDSELTEQVRGTGRERQKIRRESKPRSLSYKKVAADTGGGEGRKRPDEERWISGVHGCQTPESQCASSQWHRIIASFSGGREEKKNIWGNRRCSGVDGGRKFNPWTCWDTEEQSSGEAFATSRTSAGCRITCQESALSLMTNSFCGGCASPAVQHPNWAK